MTKFDSLVCHLCNVPGTESCDEAISACLCKPWYDGEYCQNCRFSRDYVLAPNGSCIPCNCGLRSIYECFQNNLCMKYAGESVREAVAVSALFLSAIATITCVSVCIVWRILTRSKRLSPLSVEDTDPEIGQSRRASRTDLRSALSEADFEDDDEECTSDRRFLLTPISADFENVSLASAPSLSYRPITPLASAAEDPNKDRNAVPRPFGGQECENEVPNGDGLPASSDSGAGTAGSDQKNCTKYYFWNVRREEATDDMEPDTIA